MNKKLLLGVIPALFASACVSTLRYNDKEMQQIEESVNKLKGMRVYDNYYIEGYKTYTVKNAKIKEKQIGLFSTNYYLAITLESYGSLGTTYEKNINEIDNMNKLDSISLLNKMSGHNFCSQEDFYKTDLGKKVALMYKLVKTPDVSLLENKDPKIILGKYIEVSDIKYKLLETGSSSYYFLSDDYDHTNIDINELQKVATLKLKCFIFEDKWDKKYEDNTDECILARRNYNNEIWFNYKKYLPQIKNDEHFKTVLNVFNNYYKVDINSSEFVQNTYCLNQKEITTKERNQCLKNTDTFFNQVVAGNAPHCHDKNKKKWDENLKSAQSAGSAFTNFFNMIDTYNYNSLFEANYTNELKKSAEYNVISKQVTEYGKDNFCLIDGWENDLAKLLKKNPNKRKSNTVELN